MAYPGCPKRPLNRCSSCSNSSNRSSSSTYCQAYQLSPDSELIHLQHYSFLIMIRLEHNLQLVQCHEVLLLLTDHSLTL